MPLVSYSVSGVSRKLQSVENNIRELEGLTDLADIFELVKRVVRQYLNRHRAGLMLGLANLGMKRGYFIGAFYPVGSNIIVVNKAPLKMASKTTDKKIYNAYCFLLLLHEYLHSLGYLDERQVQDLTEEVCLLAFGNGHPATVMARKGIGAYFPKVAHLPLDNEPPSDYYVELVRNFDKSSSAYIQ